MDSSTFSTLTQEEQIGRIELLARAALREFGVGPHTVTSLEHAENTTYRVMADEGEFCMRVCRPGYQSDANVASEIAFVAAMREAGFNVPRPYESRVVKIGVPEVPEARNCVLLGWQTGEFSRGGLPPARAEALGRTMAGFHEFSRRWTPPIGFDRQYLHAPIHEPLMVETPRAEISERDRELLSQVAADSRRMLDSLPKTPENFGIIHADLHFGNVLYDGEEVKVIDFDDTGWGYWIADFAAAMAYERDKPTHGESLLALMRGYESVRPLPPRTEELLLPFIRMRFLSIAEWMITRIDNPKFRESGPNWVRHFCESIRKTW